MSQNISVYHINCKVYLLKDIVFPYMLQEITAFIDKALCAQEDRKLFHEQNQIKGYCFSGFKEVERDKVYKEGNLYTFSIRCIGEAFADYLGKEVANAYTDKIKGLTCTCRKIPKLPVSKLYSVTPCIAVTPGNKGYWKGIMSLEEYENSLFSNAVKKYNHITNTKLEEDFKLYEGIRFLNHTPIGSKFKGITLLGDKLELMIGSDERAQAVAYVLLAAGIQAKNARGYGYVNYKI